MERHELRSSKETLEINNIYIINWLLTNILHTVFFIEILISKFYYDDTSYVLIYNTITLFKIWD